MNDRLCRPLETVQLNIVRLVLFSAEDPRSHLIQILRSVFSSILWGFSAVPTATLEAIPTLQKFSVRLRTSRDAIPEPTSEYQKRWLTIWRLTVLEHDYTLACVYRKAARSV
jgi:hypothetical protein